ncbi:MAG: uncharacterized protein QG558_1842 [Campylobacterota bacterium]|nr:uncharacterized protein [Campylobacterota bacterium]
MKKNDTQFLETKQLSELSHDEWEALCDGCGLCCLHKLQDEEDDSAPVLMTRVVCHCYDLTATQCSDYTNRHIKVPECTALTVARAGEFDWLPLTCAYRLRHHNLPLPSWHPLISGTKGSVRPYGLHSLNPVMETEDIDLEDYLIKVRP